MGIRLDLSTNTKCPNIGLFCGSWCSQFGGYCEEGVTPSEVKNNGGSCHVYGERSSFGNSPKL